MVIRRLAAAGLVALALTAVCCVAAAAAPWFTDSFDSYNDGSLEGQGGWMNGGDAVQVQTAFVKSEKSVMMDYLNEDWGAGESSHYVTSDGSSFYLSVDIAMDTDSPAIGENLGYVKIYNSGNDEITRIYLSHRQLKVLLGPHVPGTPTVVQDIELRRWYNVRIAVYTYNNTMDVWVDGVKKVTRGETFGTPSAVAKVAIAEWPNLTKFTKTEAYIDNITIESMSRILSPNLYTNWEAFNVMYPFAMYDEIAGDYKMWYAGSAFAQISGSNWDQWATGIAMSEDGESWVRRKFEYEPVLYAHKFYEGDVVDPATYSNIFDSIFAFGGCVIRDGSTYKMWYTGWNGDSEHIGGGITRKIHYRIGYATSPDGVAWTRYPGTAGGGSILSYGSGSDDVKGAGQPYVRKEGDTYRMWYEGLDSNGVARVLYATSSDGIAWTNPITQLNPGGSGALDEKGVRDPVVVTRNGQYELWYTGESATSPYSHAMRATSPDGLGWAKVEGQVQLHPDDPLDGNERMHVDSVIVNADNKCRVFYGKENVVPSPRIHDTHGTATDKSTCIFMEVVNP